MVTFQDPRSAPRVSACGAIERMVKDLVSPGPLSAQEYRIARALVADEIGHHFDLRLPSAMQAIEPILRKLIHIIPTPATRCTARRQKPCSN